VTSHFQDGSRDVISQPGDLYLLADIFSHPPVNRAMFLAFHRPVYQPIYRLVGPLLNVPRENGHKKAMMN